MGTRFSTPFQTVPGAHPQWVPGLFPRSNAAGRGVNPPPPPSCAEVKEGVEVYLYSPSGPSWHVLGRTLPLFYQNFCRTGRRCQQPSYTWTLTFVEYEGGLWVVSSPQHPPCNMNTLVTICTTSFNTQKFYVLSTNFICVFCVDLRRKSDYFTVQH